MTRRTILGTLLALPAMLALVLPAAAGGWATATVIPTDGNEPPAGTPVRLEVKLLQHGVTPIDCERPTLIFTRAGTTDVVAVQATAVKGETGTYRATVTFPRAGSWRMNLQLSQLFVEPGELPAFQVSGAAGPAAPADDKPAADAPAPVVSSSPAVVQGIEPVLAAAIALLAFLGGAFVGSFRRQEEAVAPLGSLPLGQ